MWLLAGQKAPDHSTIARFRTGFLAEACEDLFYQMVRRLKDAEELSKETVFIDGTKLEACANKYTFVWKKSVGKWEEKMFHEDSGSCKASESGLHAVFYCKCGIQSTGSAKNLLAIWKKNASRMEQSSSMDVADEKAKIRNIWSCSKGSGNGR